MTFTRSLLAAGMIAGLSMTMAMPSFAATKTAAVQFAKGSSSATLKGQINGNNTMQYRFYAKKGQVLSVERLPGTASQIQLSLLRGNNSTDLSGNYQVLPVNGYYTLLVSQTRNDARKAPQAARPYQLKMSITNGKATTNAATAPAATQQVTYRCDDGSLLKAHFAQRNGQPLVQVQYGRIKDTLTFDKQYSQANNPVFSSQQYSLSLETHGANLAQSHVYSLVSYIGNKDGKAIAQECVPATK